MIQTAIPQVLNCYWKDLLQRKVNSTKMEQPSIKEIHAKQFEIQTNPVYNYSFVPAPKIVVKSAWQSQQQQLQQQQQDTSESAASGTGKLVRKEEQGTPTDNPELSSVRKLERSTESLVEKEEPEF